MQITFNLPKLKRNLGQSYYLTDGGKPYSPDWHVGDEVSVMFAVTKEQQDALSKHFTVTYGSDMVHMPCKVTRRLHAIAWKQVGEFQAVCNGSVVLEPTSKRWEESLLWIAASVKPRWAE